MLEVSSVEALGEPVVNFGEHRAGVIRSAGISQQACEAGGRAQFRGFRTDLTRELDGFAKVPLGYPEARIGSLLNDGNTSRIPELTAKMATTPDHLSGGRVIWGVAASRR